MILLKAFCLGFSLTLGVEVALGLCIALGKALKEANKE